MDPTYILGTIICAYVAVVILALLEYIKLEKVEKENEKLRQELHDVRCGRYEGNDIGSGFDDPTTKD